MFIFINRNLYKYFLTKSDTRYFRSQIPPKIIVKGAKFRGAQRPPARRPWSAMNPALTPQKSQSQPNVDRAKFPAPARRHCRWGSAQTWLSLSLNLSQRLMGPFEQTTYRPISYVVTGSNSNLTRFFLLVFFFSAVECLLFPS